MKQRKVLNKVRTRRKIRVRVRIRGTSEKPRLSIFRSHKYIYAQLIDDAGHKTLASASSQELKTKTKKTDAAKTVGKLLGEKAKKAHITSAMFDRGSYRFHGRVKALAEGAKEAGLQI